MIAIIDYDAGNLKSVEKALVSLGEDCIVTRDAETILGADKVILPGVENQSYVYFVHSYYLKADHPEDVAATTDYIVPIHASVEHGNVFACQFHPEKSGDVGLQILRNFCDL